MVDVLPDDHVETHVLRKYAQGNTCAVIGAFKGATMMYLLDHGATYVYGVEPQKWAADLAIKRLLTRERSAAWELDNVALVPWETTNNGSVLLHNVGTDAASVLWRAIGSNKYDDMLVKALNVHEWVHSVESVPDGFDFMVVNVEGAEYALLPELILATNVLLVQFHGPPIPALQLRQPLTRQEIGKGWYLYT